MKILRYYGLSITLISLFLLSWLGQGIFQWQEFVQQSEQHSQSPEFQQFVPEFLARTFENWQSEFLQLASFVILAAVLIHKGSPQSKDGDEEIKQVLKRIDQKLSKR